MLRWDVCLTHAAQRTRGNCTQLQGGRRRVRPDVLGCEGTSGTCIRAGLWRVRELFIIMKTLMGFNVKQ